jgi:hypothetical protein
MRRMFHRLIVFGAVLLYLAALSSSRAYAQETPQAQAQKAAKQWLALVDAGKYGESWDASAQAFKSAVSREDWIKQVAAARRPLGKVLSRRLVKSDLVKDPPKSPPGDYVGIQYRSSFEDLKSAVETVVPMHDPDGKWRVSGYFIRAAT